MYLKFFLLIVISAIQVCLAGEDKLTPEVAREVCDYATLSEAIYLHDLQKDNIKDLSIPNGWVRVDSSRAANTDPQPDNFKTAKSTPALSRSFLLDPDPIGFHAEVYKKPDGQIAIVFEGTSKLLSYKDWKANLSHLNKYPEQYAASKNYTEKIINECAKSLRRSECIKKITVTGHSLGGGLAQYVALEFGLKANIFNPAGLFPPTIEKSGINNFSSSSYIRSFISQGYHFGWEYGSKDIVQMTGDQFALKEFTVPINLPFDAWTPIGVYSNIHNMENMEKKICEIASKSRSPNAVKTGFIIENRDFIIDQLEQVQQKDCSTLINANIFVLNEADAALEVYDVNGELFDKRAISGHRPIPSSIYDIFVTNTINVGKQFTDKYSCNVFNLKNCDFRDASQSLKTQIKGLNIPAGGFIKITKSSKNAIAYNLTRLAMEFIEEFADLGGKTINQRLYNDLLTSSIDAVSDFSLKTLFKKKPPTKEELLKYIVGIIAQAFKLENIDGRTVFGKAIKKHVSDTMPFVGQLKAIGMEGKAFNVALTGLDLNNALKNDTTVKIEGVKKSIKECIQDKNYIFTFSTALVIDRSGSMQDALTNPDGTKAQKLESAKEAAKAFILTLNATSGTAISTFSDNGNTVLPMSLVPNISQTIDQTLAKINAGGGTNIGAGLDMGFLELQKASTDSRQTALLLSDGQNNLGDLWPAVDKYKVNGWPICTIGFGNDADEATLRKIAKDTGCAYAAAQSFDIVSRYQELAAYAKGDSITLSASDLLATKGKLIYEFVVSQGAGVGNVHTHWPGSMLKTVLITPNGSRIEDTKISQNQGRYVEGKTFQMLEINNPAPGKWQVELTWKDAPPSPEQVNILVTEKTDVFARIHGLKSQYTLGKTVDINTDAFEVVNNRKIPLKNAVVKIEVKKPGEEVIRLIQAQSTSWTMYKDVLADIRRDVTMFDDGAHSDYHPQDGIFGGSFSETDKNGVYLVTATITGQKQNGEAIEKTIINTFQVGLIMNNPVSTSQTLHYIQQAEENFDNSTPVSTDLLNQPVEEIEQLQQGSDPLDEINQLLQ